jgi:hypothetical protein
MNTTGLLAAGVAASLSMATVPHAAAQERSLDEIKKEVMRRAGHINPFAAISVAMALHSAPERFSCSDLA